MSIHVHPMVLQARTDEETQPMSRWRVQEDAGEKLLSGTEMKCKACDCLLEECNFSCDDLESFVIEFASTGIAPVLQTETATLEQESVAQDQGRDQKSSVQNKEGEEDEDPFSYARKFAPTIELLEPGSFGKAFPYRCHACKNKTWPEGKVGNLNVPKASSVKFFLDQHLESAGHVKAMKRLSENGEECDDSKLVPCPAVCIGHPSAGVLYESREEFATWASMSNLSVYAKHSYWRETSGEFGDTWYIRSSSCRTHCKPKFAGRDMCDQCQALTVQHSIFGNVYRLTLKYYTSRLLSARLFVGQAEVVKVEAEMRNSFLYNRDSKKVEQLISLDNSKLQQVWIVWLFT